MELCSAYIFRKAEFNMVFGFLVVGTHVNVCSVATMRYTVMGFLQSTLKRTMPQQCCCHETQT
jgi:hypothetical protein